jgi:CheY-like chemotaxis protein
MSKKRILVVDDEPSITRLLKLNLEQTGRYEVRVENLGAKAYEAAKEFLPDLVLLDVMMPDMDGSDVAASLKEDPSLRKIPVVFLTAAVKKEELGAPDGKIGGRTYIAKPLNVQGVISVIERTIGK